ncbi:MAG: radical SAM protein [Desulfobacteraceae bacterium]|nr:radical SAM protein [Desulfobacteraceae bacterium]
MKVALIGAELEENLGLRYMASALEQAGHTAVIFPFNDAGDIQAVVSQVLIFGPEIAGLSMVFTGRAREFCHMATALRQAGFSGHITAGGHFAALNCIQLMTDFPEFDSVALGEGEELICELAAGLANLPELAGFCRWGLDGRPSINPARGNPQNLDLLPFPRRTDFHEYYGKPIASILSSRGCWRSCAFCSIDAWYRSGGGLKFRIRGIPNIVAEMKELYHTHGVRVFNFQDDNFFLPEPGKALARFTELRAALWDEGVKEIAIAVKARPDSINREVMEVLDDLGIFRVFLGVENASERGLRNLNRKSSLGEIENALKILNDFDVHVAYNLLMFEPDTNMDDILINLRFMERHIDNPFNFCRAEAYAATGLERKLRKDGIISGDYFGFDYRIKDPQVEMFHRIANYAFFNRNFNDFGLHYFNMEVDFSFQLLRRFQPELLSQGLRSEVRSFIKETNIDTYRCLSRIWDLVQVLDPSDEEGVKAAMRSMRQRVDEAGKGLRIKGEQTLERLRRAYERQEQEHVVQDAPAVTSGIGILGAGALPYSGVENLGNSGDEQLGLGFFGALRTPVPYAEFRKQLEARN